MTSTTVCRWAFDPAADKHFAIANENEINAYGY